MRERIRAAQVVAAFAAGDLIPVQGHYSYPSGDGGGGQYACGLHAIGLETGRHGYDVVRELGSYGSGFISGWDTPHPIPTIVLYLGYLLDDTWWQAQGRLDGRRAYRAVQRWYWRKSMQERLTAARWELTTLANNACAFLSGGYRVRGFILKRLGAAMHRLGRACQAASAMLQRRRGDMLLVTPAARLVDANAPCFPLDSTVLRRGNRPPPQEPLSPQFSENAGLTRRAA